MGIDYLLYLIKVIMLELKEKLNAFIIILNKIAPAIG